MNENYIFTKAMKIILCNDRRRIVELRKSREN